MKPIRPIALVAATWMFVAALVMAAATTLGDDDAVSGPPQQGTAPIEAAARPSAADETELKAEFAEIQRIRDRLGINLYRGTVLERSPDDPDPGLQFLEVYRRVAQRPRPPVRRTASTDVGNALPFSPAPLPGDIELVHALGAAGRQLDLAASQRESSRQFDEAARLRRLARRIRKLLPQLNAAER